LGGVINRAAKEIPMLSRRQLFHTGLVTGCAACAALATHRLSAAGATDSAMPKKLQEPGYSLSYLGSQRQTIMTGDRGAHFDLRTLKGRPHLYGIGPIEGLTGEVTIVDSRPSLARVGADQAVNVTESYEAGVPFFVWAEVPAWQAQEIPDVVRTYAELEKIVGEAGARAGLTQAFPFVMTGRPELIDFHIVNATPATPPGMEAHQKIQIPFEVHRRDVTLVGFWSSQHQGVFTPMGTNIHAHFQTPDNKVSGHVQGLELTRGMMLSLPRVR
jgi:acetolactate decarboxylase